MNIYVGNLPYRTTEDELYDLFTQYGTVVKTAIIMDRDTGRSRGYGFVEMPDREEGAEAIEALAGNDFNGRPLTINEARKAHSADVSEDEDSDAPVSSGYSNRLIG